MPRHYRDYKPTDRLFTFIDEVTGENINIDSEALRLWCAEHRSDLQVYMTPVTDKMANRMLADNVVDFLHVLEVLEMPELDPIIYLKTGTTGANGGPDVMLADGHHRYIGAVVVGLSEIPSYLLEPYLWKDFVVEGVPKQTADELRRARPAPSGHLRGKK